MAGINNKKVWVNGDDTDAAWFNAAQNPTFTKNPATDDLINPNENWQLTNTSLSRASGNILPEWEAFRDTLKVSPGTGLNVGYTGGAIKLPDGAIATIAPSTIAAPNNVTSTVYVQENGTVAVSTDPPPMTIPLALVTTVAGAITSIVDLRTPYQLLPRPETIKILGGFSTTDFTLSGNATFSLGEYLFRSFRIEATGVLTVDKFVTIYCTDAVINGSIIVNTSSKGTGGNYRRIYGSGGFATGIGFGASSGDTPGETYNYKISPLGSSGSEGGVETIITSTVCTSSKGGNGGGSIIIEASRSITVNGTIIANGGNAVIGNLGDGSVMLSGGGGGSGGSIILKSKNIILSATASLSVIGGNGANGIASTNTNGARGGGGGGGGVISLQAPTITNNATILLSGGAVGSSVSYVSNLGVGSAAGAGFGGTGGNGGVGGGGSYGTAGSPGLLLMRYFLPVF